MKREIVCEDCIETVKGLFPGFKLPFKNELMKVVWGRLKDWAICDDCGEDMAPEEKAFALSFWLKSRNDYYPWESEYLTIDQG